MEAIEIHSLDTAAERAKVSREKILEWIRAGLRAMPVGKIGKRGPRDYRIFDDDLVAFIRSRRVGGDLVPTQTTTVATKPARAAGRPKKGTTEDGDRLWPKPY